MGVREASSGDVGFQVSFSAALPEHPDEMSMDISRPDVNRPPLESSDSNSMHQESQDARLKRVRIPVRVTSIKALSLTRFCGT